MKQKSRKWWEVLLMFLTSNRGELGDPPGGDGEPPPPPGEDDLPPPPEPPVYPELPEGVKIAGKYTSIGEAEKGYKSLESEMGTMRDELSTLRDYVKVISQTARPPGAPTDLPPGAPAPPAAVKPEDIISEADMANFYTNPREVLGNLAIKLHKAISENVNTTITTQTGLSNVARDTRAAFYDSNPDLKGYERVVGDVAAEVQAANPYKNPRDLLNDVAEKSRERLTKIGKDWVTPGKKPTTSGGGGGTRKPPVPEGRKELDEMAFRK